MAAPLVRAFANQGVVFAVDGDIVLICDATLSRTENLSSEVSEYRLETGANIVNHVYPDAPRLSMNILQTAAPVDYDDATPADRDVAAWRLIRSLQGKAILLTVTTAEDSFEDYVIVSARRTQDEGTGQKLVAQLELRKIEFAASEVVEIPPEIIREESGARSGGSSEQEGGERQSTPPGDSDEGAEEGAEETARRRSGARALADAFSGLTGG